MMVDDIKLEIHKYYFRTPIKEIKSFNNLALLLESLLHDPCLISETNGKYSLIETFAVVDIVRGMKIEIYPNEHQPPHFHVKTQSIQAAFRIDDCTIIKGDISSGNYKKIVYWHNQSKDVLIDFWNKMRPTNCTVGEYQEI